MGFREKIGLKPKASTVNLSSAMNNGLGVGGGYTQQQQQQNMYSIPESGYASTPQQARQQQHQQQQPRTMGGLGNNIPFATRLGPGGGTSQTSFEGNRSVSSGSAYSYTAGSTSTASFATTNTNNTSSTHSSYGNSGLGAGLRNFSNTSSKSNLSSKTAQANPHPQQYLPQDPTITAADVRRCTKLLRQMFELHLELWTLTYTHGTEQYRRHEKRLQVEAILVDIHNMVGAWHAMPPSTWTEEEYEEIKWIVSTLADLPPPPY